MIVEFSQKVSTTMSLDNRNSTDAVSACDLAEYISQELFNHNQSVICSVQTRAFGKMVFEVKIKDNLCIDTYFRCEICAIAKVDSDRDSNDVWNELYEEAPEIAKQLVDSFVAFIKEMNASISIMCPSNESYIFKNKLFYIEMDPTAPYQPEFVKFALDDSIDEDELAGELYVK